MFLVDVAVAIERLFRDCITMQIVWETIST